MDKEMQDKLERAASKAAFEREQAAAMEQLKHCRAFVLVTMHGKTDEVEARSHWYSDSLGAIPLMHRFYIAATDLVTAQMSRFTMDFKGLLGG